MLLCNNLAESISIGEPNGAQWDGIDLLILLPVTGRSGGKRKRTVVTRTYAMPSCCKIVNKGRMELRNGKGPTRLQNHPRGPGNTKGLGGSILRPRRQLIAGGMA